MIHLKTTCDTRRTRKDGTHPIVFRITLNSKSRDLASGYSCTKADWDSNNNTVKPKTDVLIMMAKRIHDQDSTLLNVFAAPVTLPFTEDFETNVFVTGEWTLENPDNDVTWELVTVGGITPGSSAAKIDFFSYANAAQRDAIISPPVSLAGYLSAELSFDHAYRRFNQNAADSLIVYFSSDCGQTWDRVLAAAEDGTGSFATQTTNTNAFTPSIADDWCFSGTIGATCFTIDLSSYIEEDILVKFESYNAGTIGNNLFLDNINIDGVPGTIPPVANFTTNSTILCEGEPITFTDQSTANTTSWDWSFQGGSPATSTAQNPVVSYASAGTYNVTLTATNSFGTDTESMTITVNPLPSAPVITQSGNNLSVVLQAGETASWSYNGNVIGSGSNITMIGTGVYEVTITNTSGCDASISDSYEMDVTSLNDLSLDNSILVYPNPTKGFFTLDFVSQSKVQMWITDAVGRKVTQTRFYSEGVQTDLVDISNFQPGIYILVFDSGDGILTRKITKK